MLQDFIKLGETYTISADGLDEAGLPFLIPSDWEIRALMRSGSFDGPIVADLPLPIVDGIARVSIDTGNAPFAVGIYFYDVRCTDADGNDFWNDIVKLTINTRLTQPST